MRLFPTAFLICALLAVLPVGAPFAQSGHFGQSPEISFLIKGDTPQYLADNPTINYQPEQKFPNYISRTGFTFSTSVNRREWSVGDSIAFNYDAGRSGYVSIIDYSPDGVGIVVLRNQPIRDGFNYVFTSEVSEPAGDDYLRAVLSTTRLNYPALRSLCEYPCETDVAVKYVVSERWLKITVRGSHVQQSRNYDDPFYSYPHRWYRATGGDQYYYVQPSGNTVLARGLVITTDGIVHSDFTEYGPAQYWLLEPGDRIDLSFNTSDFPYSSPTLYLLLYASPEGGSGLLGAYDSPKLRVRFNGMTVTDGFAPQYAGFYDDAPPEVISLADFLRYGGNSIELRLDPFAGTALRLRRVELRASLDDFTGEFVWPGNG